MMACYPEAMRAIGIAIVFLSIIASTPSTGQTPSSKHATNEPSLPVIDENACPFEGCSFQKWIVKNTVTLFSTWKEDRTPLTKVSKGKVVAGETGVHITWEPDRVQILKPVADLQLEPGDILLRYMYRGEGFADVWANGQWKKEYDCSFIQERDGSGCTRGCGGKVISEGRKEWWVRVRTTQGLTGWTKETESFDCMDLLGGDAACSRLQSRAAP
jgi:hypothetical protein